MTYRIEQRTVGPRRDVDSILQDLGDIGMDEALTKFEEYRREHAGLRLRLVEAYIVEDYAP